ncbi:hypothetical protein F444_08129 [Phytophthora nicotianae P1976]|uniref:Uncharacterized protein n=1 Tax=Phytophthora nicotianae P1976 TaxID=1317066 RepID=A0A081AC98_PHYNI|nr:hypothetical protein F444_08129 [Phytophthora nicotianae P1976]
MDEGQFQKCYKMSYASFMTLAARSTRSSHATGPEPTLSHTLTSSKCACVGSVVARIMMSARTVV